MIKIEKVNKYFNRHKRNQIHVINNTSFELGDNGLVALLGPSGSGKTTLLNAIGGLDKISSGKIFINGIKITKRSANKIDDIRNLNIGYIFQDYHLIDNMSVYDNIALVLKMINIKDKEEIKKRVNYCLESVGMYRYRNRLAGMLSGGERQRVGIARAIVKNPSIIIADEPTGNLDSKNTIEIMNIIKSISKDKLVILVTHEKDIAYFYSTRVIELRDGEVITDKENSFEGELDYKIDNKIYLKDIKNHTELKSNNVLVNVYNDENKNVNIDIVIKNGNIYLKTENNEKLELVDDSSNIELINEHYKKMDKSTYEKYAFDYEKVINKNIRLKYKSILNPITLIINGFKKVFDYPFLKKVLLLGFFTSGMFILYSISNILGITNIKDEKFVTQNKQYLNVITSKIEVNDYLNYEKLGSIDYIIPGDSKVSFSVLYDDVYQTSAISDNLNGSLSSIDLIQNKDLIYGLMPRNDREIIVDKFAIEKMFENFLAPQAGILDIYNMVGRYISLEYVGKFKIVGLVDLKSPSIYMEESMFVNILANSGVVNEMDGIFMKTSTSEVENINEIIDYNLLKDEMTITKGKEPTEDYEVLINESMQYSNKIGKYLDIKVNDNNLKVVGYYHDKKNRNIYLVNNNTIKYNLISNKPNLTINPKDEESVFDYFESNNMNIESSYDKAKSDYKKSINDSVVITLVVAGIVLLISLIEIFLMVRSSFLSRIKEVGILRSIGLKKKDVYKMFLGEIIAITTLASFPGYLLMIYIVKNLTSLPLMKDQFILNNEVLIISIVLIYAFNIIVGLLPVFNTLRKTPASILSRTDI